MRLFLLVLVAQATAMNMSIFSRQSASPSSWFNNFGFSLDFLGWSMSTNTATNKFEDFAPDECKCLVQSDFVNGTFIINSPGDYKLCEDIVFSPLQPPPGKLPEDACDPVFPSVYDENAFGLGFFAAIAITAPNVTLYLNNYTIAQGADHALLQRFFAVIELAGSPFIKNAGPAQFMGADKEFMAASNVLIQGPGTIGLSAHHGIHGNNNADVVIRDVTFRDFEVAAVSLNKVHNLLITKCDIPQNRQDIPVLGMFSAARFIRPYGKYLKMKNYTIQLRGQEVSAATLYDNLLATIENVFGDVMSQGYINATTHPVEFDLFDNARRIAEGPCYAFLVHGHGPAIGDQGDVFGLPNATSSNITITDNKINNIRCWTNEAPAAVVNNTVMIDVRGSVFQFVRPYDGNLISINADGTYKGNVVADMQIMVAHAILDGTLEDNPLHQIKINKIGQEMIDWASSATAKFDPQYRCNGDSMHHVNKGVIVFRVEDSLGVTINDNTLREIYNESPLPFTNCVDLHAGINVENEGEQQGANVRAISLAAVRPYSLTNPSTVVNNKITNLYSENANVVIGIDIQGDTSDVKVVDNLVNIDPAIGRNKTDTCYAMRLRENAENIDIGTNAFFQDILRLNWRRLGSPPRRSLSSKTVDDNEYNLGGCPFAHMIGTRLYKH